MTFPGDSDTVQKTTWAVVPDGLGGDSQSVPSKFDLVCDAKLIWNAMALLEDGFDDTLQDRCCDG